MLKMLICILSELDTFSQKYFNILCVGTLSIKYFYYDTQNFCHTRQLAQKFQHPSSFSFDKQRQGKVLSIYFMLCLMTQKEETKNEAANNYCSHYSRNGLGIMSFEATQSAFQALTVAEDYFWTLEKSSKLGLLLK